MSSKSIGVKGYFQETGKQFIFKILYQNSRTFWIRGLLQLGLPLVPKMLQVKSVFVFLTSLCLLTLSHRKDTQKIPDDKIGELFESTMYV